MRWLLVNLQDSKEFASQILNRDVWSDYNVKELIKRNFIFMQVIIVLEYFDVQNYTYPPPPPKKRESTHNLGYKFTPNYQL